jgi:hypothetical protein
MSCKRMLMAGLSLVLPVLYTAGVVDIVRVFMFRTCPYLSRFVALFIVFICHYSLEVEH